MAFESDRGGDAAIFRQRADGSGPAERLTMPPRMRSTGRTRGHPMERCCCMRFTKTLSRRCGRCRSRIEKWHHSQTRVPQAISTAHFHRTGGGWHIKCLNRQSRLCCKCTCSRSLRPGPSNLVGAGGHPYWTPKGTDLIINTGPGRSAVVPVTTSPRVTFGQPLAFSRNLRAEPNPATGRRSADHMPEPQRYPSE